MIVELGIMQCLLQIGSLLFTLLKDDGESGSESEFTDIDTDYSNDFKKSDSELRIRVNVPVFMLKHLI